MKQIHQWDVFELERNGPSEGNPFIDQTFSATFSGQKETVTAEGFYDGDGVYKVRFMPSHPGVYTYEIHSSFPVETPQGRFEVTPPAPGNHGPVQVSDTFHFSYADGTRYYPVGTTCYVWTHQPEALQKQTLHTLARSPFNKIRFCILPKSYRYNCKDPITFPYEGTPCDASGMNFHTYQAYTPHTPGNHWDFFRFQPDHFRRIERQIQRLMQLGIEADLIVMHPYDRWGFSMMPPQADDLYWRYVLARFSAFRNVWWSLSNEYDLFPEEAKKDWEHFAQLILQHDPYHHLRSIHNGPKFYDYSRPWITHCSMQRRDFTNDFDDIPKYREMYQKPVIFDEMHYEGDIEENWGNIDGEELVRRSWICAVYGAYSSHGETYYNKDEILWWSHGGKLHGTSPARLAFLRQILEDLPGSGILRPGEAQCAVLDEGSEDTPEFYLYYYGVHQPKWKTYQLTPGKTYRVDAIDTWNMTLASLGSFSAPFEIKLPGKRYIAVRITEEK